MLFRKRLPKTKKGDFYPMEKKVIGFVIQSLTEEDSRKLDEQIKFLVLKKRIKYPKSFVTEMYPVQFNGIPKDYLFSRTEEFRLATLKLEINGQNFYCQCNMVLGVLFDISLKPIPDKKQLESADIILKEIQIESELWKNLD